MVCVVVDNDDTLHSHTITCTLAHFGMRLRFRVENVEDVVALDDVIDVKVLEIQVDEETGRRKVRLSKKDVEGPVDAASQAITQSLNSSIGMGVAMDPMERRSDNLLLKSRQGGAGGGRGQLINGYALVGDDEGEPERPKPTPAAATAALPLGRGRGTALPAWMTKAEGPTGNVERNDGGKRKRKSEKKERKREAREERRKERRERKERKKRSRKEERRKKSKSKSSRSTSKRKRHRYSDAEDDENDVVEKKRRKSKSNGSDGQSSDSSDSDDDRSYDSESSYERPRRKHKTKRGYSDDESDSERDDLDGNGEDFPFKSVEEAERLIAKLESRKGRKKKT